MQAILEQLGDLLAEPLLDLKVTGEEPNDSRELGEPQDAGSGEVADVRDTGEGEQVVLAERVKRDVADDDERLVVALVVGNVAGAGRDSGD